MREVYVYHSPRNYEAADAFVAELRSRTDVGLVRQGRSDRWGGEILGDAIFHDGSNRALAWAHEEAGIPVELFGKPLTQTEKPAAPIEVPAPAPEPEAATDAEEEGWPDGYTAEQGGSWYTVLAPDGEVVGKAQGEAAAQTLAWEHARG